MDKDIKFAFDFIEESNAIENADQLQAKFYALAKWFGFKTVAAGDLVNPELLSPDEQPIFVSRWPTEWETRWVSEGYVMHDPVVFRSLRHPTPFFWSDIRSRQKGLGARIMDEGGDFGLYDGFSIPIQRQKGQTSSVTLAGDKPDLNKREIAALHLAGIYYFARLEQLLRAVNPDRTPQLSPRERTCLHWVAAGKSDWDISQILAISEHTVHDYVRSAMKKFNATTRAQTVALAIRASAIAP